MAESRDSAIKLFGKTIPLQPSGCSGEEEKDHKEEDHESPDKEEKSDPPTTTARETDKPSSTNQEDTAMKDSKPIQQSNETSNFQEKAPKKPDKILPCPRCNSLDTKFCYFNNYNVNQPRYFCKKCQRYWTAGGVVRNVPVGAGRRKNKNPLSYYRHITMSDATLQTVRSDVMKAIRHSPLKPNGTVLSFGSDMPFRESMASVQSPEKTVKGCTRNRCHQMEEKMVPLSCRVGKGDEQSNSKQEVAKTNLQGVPATITCFNGTPWPHQWRTPTPSSTTGLATPFYPTTAYWGCEVPGPWIIPWLSSPLASPNNSGSPGAGPNSPTLGKHSRDGNAFKSSNVDQR